MPTSCYEQVLRVAEDYLGPAAKRFIRRQVEFHLEKPPEEISQKDVPRIAESMRIGLGLLTADKKTVDTAYKRILAIRC